MKMAISSTLCILLLVSCCSISTCTLDASGLSGGSIKTLANIGKSGTAAYSCSSSRATSSGGSSIATSASTAKAFASAVTACATAVGKAFTSAGAGCQNTDVTVSIYTAARACASSAIKLRTSTLASALSKGKASAISSACSSSKAWSSSTANAIADVFAKTFASNGLTCAAFTNSSAKSRVEAVAQAMTKGFASSYVFAAANGNSASKATASAMFTADVGVYAKAISNLLSYGCTNCGNYNSCIPCAERIDDGDDATDSSVAIATQGRFALATAFSDAVSAACQKKISVQAASQSMLKAVGDVCVQIAASALGTATKSGNAIACTGSYSSGSGFGLSKAFGNLVVDAAAEAFKNDECASQAFSSLKSEVFEKVTEYDFVQAVQSNCETQNSPDTVPYSVITEAIIQKNREVFSEALSEPLSYVISTCECSGAGWCCQCPDRKDCDF